MFPTSAIQAMARNEILQILVFSISSASPSRSFKDEGATTLVKSIGELAHVMLRMTDYVMRFAPFGVFAAIAS